MRNDDILYRSPQKKYENKMLLALSLIVLVLLLVACFPSLERELVYLPQQKLYQTPHDIGLPYQEVKINTADGLSLRSWLIAPDEASYTTRPWLIYFHGNSSNISEFLSYPQQLFTLGYNVMMVEYRGFLGNEGIPHEAGLYLDAQAHYDYLRHLGVAAEHIILHGMSLGTGVATDLASKVPVAALILEAPYTSIPATARFRFNKGLGDWLFQNHFRSIDKISTIDAPLLIIHAEDDRIVPFFMGEELFAAALEPKYFIAIKGGHSALAQGMPSELQSQVADFLARASPAP